MYNTTQLNPDTTFERHVYHRDQFAHYLRWTHVLKIAKIGMNVLDIGCGSGNLLEVFYRNRYKLNRYLGVDVRNTTIKKATEKWNNVNWAEFKNIDACNNDLPIFNWHIVCCFEVLEHVGKEQARNLLKNIYNVLLPNSILLISTPCYDPSVGAANNHIINDEVGEFTYDELKTLLNEFFDIENNWGTFASQKDYKQLIEDSPFKEYYDTVKNYFDSNILSNLMAPLFPEQSRNVLWRLRKKGE